MDRWIAQLTEGYVTRAGRHVTLVDERLPTPSWPTIADAREAVRLATPGWSECRNGFKQVDDVASRPKFGELDVATIWRAVTFVKIIEAP